MKTIKRLSRYCPLLPFLIIVGIYEVVPLAFIVVRGFYSPGTTMLSVENYQAVLSKKVYLTCIRNSMYVSLLSAFAGLAISFLTALSLTKVSPKIQSVGLSLLNITSNFGGVALAFAFIIILGSAGVLVNVGRILNIGFLADFDLYSRDGLIFMYIYFQIPLGTLLLLPAFEAIKVEWKESAALMKASSTTFWLRLGIPVLAPSLLSTFSILFANALTAFNCVYALVSNSFLLLPIKIQSMFVGDVKLQPELGSALSTIMLLILVAVMGACNLVKWMLDRRMDK